MIILSSATGTGIISTTPGANGVIASVGNWANKAEVKVSYNIPGSSGTFAGCHLFRGGNFAVSAVFPGTAMKFEIVSPPDGYNAISIEITESP